MQQVGSGMFAWRESEMPTESNPALVNMPPAKFAAEQELLIRLGYNPETGAPAAQECRS